MAHWATEISETLQTFALAVRQARAVVEAIDSDIEWMRDDVLQYEPDSETAKGLNAEIELLEAARKVLARA